MNDVLLVLSIIISLIALIGSIGGIFYWKGKVDTHLCNLQEIPAKVQQHSTKIDVLWALFVEQTLEGGGGRLAVRGSGYKLTEEGEKCAMEIADILKKVQDENPNMGASDVLTIVAQEVGMEELRKLANKNGCTSAEYLSVLTVKLGIEI